MTLSRNDQDWSVLLNEYNICKKKLESKRQGLKILMSDLERIQIDRDKQKNKVIQLKNEVNDLKEVLREQWQNNSHSNFEVGSDDKKIKMLRNLLQFSRDENIRFQHDLDNLKQLYSESQRDNQLLRASLSTYEAQKKVGLHEKQDKEKLIIQLEDSIAKVSVLEEELQLRNDELKELNEERISYRKKNDRLNTELNYILHNDDKRIVDVDNLVLENQYLKEVVKQYKQEKATAVDTAIKYKEALKQRNSSTKGRLSYLDLMSSAKPTSDSIFSKSYNTTTVVDLQRVNQALTEKLSEKETALRHQRNTNRILGTRVSELEKKLKTLEISGLWSHEQRVPRDIKDQANTTILTINNGILQPEHVHNYKDVLQNVSHPTLIGEQQNSNGDNSYSNCSNECFIDQGLDEINGNVVIETLKKAHIDPNSKWLDNNREQNDAAKDLDEPTKFQSPKLVLVTTTGLMECKDKNIDQGNN